MSRLQHHALASAWIALGLLFATPARAASVQKVEQSTWNGGVTLPSYVNMYIYVPDTLATKPPILVANHHCQGTGTGTYNETKSTLVPLADKNGFIMIFPEATGHNCWDVGSAKSLKHDGGGDTHAVAQMVRYTLTKYNADAGRVYAFGGSSGGMMTQGLLGVYPDIFMAGVSISGVPCGCWAEQYTGDVASNGQWSGPCAGGTVTKTAQQWGDLVRSMHPSYTGHRPRVQLWHGDPDSTISFNNMGEAIKEWTNVLALSTTPTATDTSKANTTHQTWKSSCDYTVFETFAIEGAGHAVQWDTPTVAGFLGLDKAGGEDPEAAACPGTGGTGGVSGSGGTTGAGGAGGVGDGGSAGRDAGRDGGRDATGTGGAVATGGGVGSGGAGGMGGSPSGGGGSSDRGGATGNGGATGSGGGAGSSGGSARGGATGNGGSVAAGGSLASGGGGQGLGGTQANGGSSGTGGDPGTGGKAAGGDSGCGCELGSHGRGSGAQAFALFAIALGWLLRRRASRTNPARPRVHP